MKERPVIFNGEMVRAILDGRKTQTRRVMKVQPKPSETRPGDFWFSSKKLESMVHVSDFTPGNSPIADCHLFFQEHCCPFGQAGDRMWVRETFGDCGNRLVYRAATEDGAASQVKRWVPSIHMPRDACRILLEITAVRVERLNDISEEDAKAEGVRATENNFGNGPAYCDYLLPNLDDTAEWYNRASDSFKSLWKSIYGAENWRANPWVWVIEFRRLEVRDASK
ncbi:hypothetical protein [Serratia marcescens]|uniref:hypothetical protein n=1 Tax=Serratia marcescens TaxID=615 RepID=UPI0009A4D3B2|nr:hypothetical protein [Serratia marcescens]OPJ96495.1 hypothetical protein B1R44_10920 [Serratia marcescens]